MTLQQDWTELAVQYTAERIDTAYHNAMEEPADARRVLTYLRGVGCGKFDKSGLSALLEVDWDVIGGVVKALGLEHYADDDSRVWYVFNSDTFQSPAHDRAFDAIETENAELKAKVERLKAELAQADADHGETLQAFERLELTMRSVCDVILCANVDSDEKSLRYIIKNMLTRALKGNFSYLVQSSAPSTDKD